VKLNSDNGARGVFITEYIREPRKGNICLLVKQGRWSTVVGLVIRLETGGFWELNLTREGDFSQNRPYRLSGCHVLLINCYRVVFLGVKRLGKNYQLSPPSKTEREDECSYTGVSPI
jgi:hypothetical protein